MTVVRDCYVIVRGRSSTRIRRFDKGKRVRSEDRKCDDRYYEGFVRSHAKVDRHVRWAFTTPPEDMLPSEIKSSPLPPSKAETARSPANIYSVQHPSCSY